MSNTAVMFLNNLSVVDHAFIDNEGAVVGGSFNPSFLVEGNIDPVEQVVVDFSAMKKQLKDCIDDPVMGFDHKLWIVECFSNCEIIIDGNVQVNFDLLDSDAMSPSTRVRVRTPYAELGLPKDAIKFIPSRAVRRRYSIESAGLWFQQHLNEKFKDLNIACHNSIDAHTYIDTPISYFSYVHGLRDSTSWGCQNIAHGHLSFVQIESNHPDTFKVQTQIAKDLDRSVFIYDDNISPIPPNVNEVMFDYNTSRGDFIATLDDNYRQKCTIIDTETTIENLVNWITIMYSNELRSINAQSIYVSEGLSKGAYQSLR